jgi:hypothetical protein
MPETWQFETADFRRTAYTRTTHDGRPYLIATCQSFERGKWEGFVSMFPETPESRWSTRVDG